MSSPKKYTNQTITKRVDHEAGRHHTKHASAEPAVCKVCGDVYANRRWSLPDPERKSEKHPHFRPALQVVCPACQRQQDNVPSGYLYLTGAFLAAHREEIEQLLHNEVERTAQDNPLARIINWEREGPEKVTLTTTTEHLAQRLGHALEKAYDGEVRYDFSHENKLARVYWHRE